MLVQLCRGWAGRAAAAAGGGPGRATHVVTAPELHHSRQQDEGGTLEIFTKLVSLDSIVYLRFNCSNLHDQINFHWQVLVSFCVLLSF